MSIAWVTAGTTVAGLGASYQQSKELKEGAKAAAASSDRAADLQMEQYQTSRRDLAPWMGAGESALYDLAALNQVDMPYARGQGGMYSDMKGAEREKMALQIEIEADEARRKELLASGNKRHIAERRRLDERLEARRREMMRLTKTIDRIQGQMTPVQPGGTAGRDRMLSRLEQSPDYQFALQQGLKATDYAMNRRGLLRSGRQDRERQKFATGLASTKLADYRNALAGMAGTGQTAGTSVGQLGAGAAGQAGMALQNAGAARQSGYAAGGNAWANAANLATGAIGQYAGYQYLMKP